MFKKEKEISEEKLEEKKEQESDEEAGLEETLEQTREAMSSEEFARFLQESTETKPPVLERIQEDIPLETGFQAWRPEEETGPEDVTRTDERQYIPTSEETPYQPPIQANIEPPVLTPRNTMPQEEIPRHELLDPRQAISGRIPTKNLYPELLESEEKDKKEYYKIIE